MSVNWFPLAKSLKACDLSYQKKIPFGQLSGKVKLGATFPALASDSDIAFAALATGYVTFPRLP